MTGELGLVIDGRVPIRQAVKCAKFAEETGLESVWTTDITPREAFVPLTACALATKRVRLGTASTCFPVRSPIVTAGMVAALDELSRGRMILGLGTGGVWMKSLGVVRRYPVRELREYVEVLRRLLAGERFSYNGEFFTVSDWNWWDELGYKPPRADVPIYVAGVGPRIIQLAGEVGDGGLLGGVNPLTFVKTAKARLQKAAVTMGRDSSKVRLAALLLTSVGSDSLAAKKTLKQTLAAYSSLDMYGRVLEDAGHGRRREKILAAMSRGDTATATSLVSDKMVDDVALAGTGEECRAKLDQYRRAGVDVPILYVTKSGKASLYERCKFAIRELSR